MLFIRKYPSIHSDEERDQYRAVFNDQYAEYRDLHAEVQAMARKFQEMDEMMHSLPSRPSSQMVQPLRHTHTRDGTVSIHPIVFQEMERIDHILMEYRKKKSVSLDC